MPSSSDFEALVPAIYDAAVETDMWPDVLELLADCVGVDAVYLAQMPLPHIWLARVWSYGVDRDCLDAFMQPSTIGRSAYLGVCMALGEGVSLDLGRQMSDDATGDDPSVRVFLAPQRLLEGRFGPVTKGEGMITPLACLRDSRRGPMCPERTRTMGILMRHLRCAMAIQQRLMRLTERNEMLVRALDPLAVGILAVTADLGVVFANEEAERIAALGDGVSTAGGRLVLRDPARQLDLKAAVARMGRRSPDAQEPYLHLARPSGAPPFTLCVSPSTAATGGIWLGRAAATVFITDPASPVAIPTPEQLAERFGLTAAEAEVARLAAMGRGMPFVARALGVSLNTVRTHLKAVYDKTGVNRQARLARTVAESFPPVRRANGAG